MWWKIAKSGFKLQHESYLYRTRLAELDNYDERCKNQVLHRIAYRLGVSEVISRCIHFFFCNFWKLLCYDPLRNSNQLRNKKAFRKSHYATDFSSVIIFAALYNSVQKIRPFHDRLAWWTTAYYDKKLRKWNFYNFSLFFKRQLVMKGPTLLCVSWELITAMILVSSWLTT